jgi:hypothetical protein
VEDLAFIKEQNHFQYLYNMFERFGREKRILLENLTLKNAA